jgi:hypothetical protein
MIQKMWQEIQFSAYAREDKEYPAPARMDHISH